MRLPDEVLKSVIFLGQRDLDPRTGVERTRFGGTAFFVAMPIGNGVDLLCLVTAKHVAEKIDVGEFCIRANTKGGGSTIFWLDAGIDVKWIYHPTDDSVDVAILLWAPPAAIDFRSIPSNMFLSKEKLLEKRIGVGDETYVTGLFRFIQGTDRNEPIVRTGHVAMMPLERIPVRWHKRGIEGHLIEARSIGGLSGSPVFVQRSIEVKATEPSGRTPLGAGAIFWFGLIHGHWDIDDDRVDGISSDGSREEAINAGIAVVVPCYKILEALEQPSVVDVAGNALSRIEVEYQALFDGCSPNSVKRGKEAAASHRLVAAMLSDPALCR